MNRGGNKAKCYYCDWPGHFQCDCRVMKRHQMDAAQRGQPPALHANRFTPYARPQEARPQQGAMAQYQPQQQQYDAAPYPPLHTQLMAHQPPNTTATQARQGNEAVRKEVRFEGCSIDLVKDLECLNIEVVLDILGEDIEGNPELYDNMPPLQDALSGQEDDLPSLVSDDNSSDDESSCDSGPPSLVSDNSSEDVSTCGGGECLDDPPLLISDSESEGGDLGQEQSDMNEGELEEGDLETLFHISYHQEEETASPRKVLIDQPIKTFMNDKDGYTSKVTFTLDEDLEYQIEVTSATIKDVLEVYVIHGQGYTPAVVKGTINGETVQTLLDTGATISLIGEKMLVHIGADLVVEHWDNGPVKIANRRSMHVVGVAKVTLKIDCATIVSKFIVVKELSRDVIIGKDILKLTKAVMDMGNDTVAFGGCPPLKFRIKDEVAMVEVNPSVFTVACSTDCVIPPKSEKIIEVDVDSDAREVMMEGIIKDLDLLRLSRPFAVGNSLVSLAQGDVVSCQVINLTDLPVKINRGDIIGEIKKYEHLVQTEVNAVDAPPTFDLASVKLGDDLTGEQRKRVHELLSRYKDVFMENLTQPGQLKVDPFRIDIIPGTTIKKPRPFRKSEAEHDKIKAFNDDKLKKGVAETSSSVTAAPTMLVPKKDGKLRMCVDLRDLNKITIGVVYPIPRPDDLFTVVRGNAYFSLADATWGYWQLEVLEVDIMGLAHLRHSGGSTSWSRVKKGGV